MSNRKCFDYSFGCIPSDIQATNAKITNTLAACDASAQFLSGMPIVSIQTSESQAISTVVDMRTPIRWNRPIAIEPPSFQASPTTFIIPETGLYLVNTTITYNEQVGNSTIIITVLTVNGQDLFGLSYSPLDANQIDFANGNVTARFLAGDSLVINAFQFFGSSPNVQYIGGVHNISLTRLSIYKIGD